MPHVRLCPGSTSVVSASASAPAPRALKRRGDGSSTSAAAPSTAAYASGHQLRLVPGPRLCLRPVLAWVQVHCSCTCMVATCESRGCRGAVGAVRYLLRACAYRDVCTPSPLQPCCPRAALQFAAMPRASTRHLAILHRCHPAVYPRPGYYDVPTNAGVRGMSTPSRKHPCTPELPMCCKVWPRRLTMV